MYNIYIYHSNDVRKIGKLASNKKNVPFKMSSPTYLDTMLCTYIRIYINITLFRRFTHYITYISTHTHNIYIKFFTGFAHLAAPPLPPTHTSSKGGKIKHDLSAERVSRCNK